LPDENPSSLGAFEFALRFRGQYADKETNLFYNVFRDYDSMLGRYAESDPIGMRGGKNGYAYVGNDPLRYIDPLGLVKWSGTVLAGSGGPGSTESHYLTSECKCNKRVYVQVRANYFSVGAGSPFTYTGQTEEFEDGAACPIASIFEGGAARASTGIAAGIGFTCGVTTLGRANSTGCGLQAGYDGGASMSLFGRSYVVSSSEEKCCP
jgi:RHS repeat-associated protein